MKGKMGRDKGSSRKEHDVSKLQATHPGDPGACDGPQAAVKPSGKPPGAAKARPASKPVAKKPAAPAKKPAAKAPAKSAKPAVHAKPAPAKSKPSKPSKPSKAPAKSGSKPHAKAAPSKSAVSKPAANAANAPAKPAAKPATPITLKSASPANAAVPASPPNKQAPATKRAGGTAAVATPAKSTARASAKAPAHMPLPAVPTAADQASRFADRFSPAKQAPRVVIDAGAEAQKHVRKDPKLANAWKSKSGRDLSEEELMAMPDNEYMNDQQLDFFRKSLTQLKDDLLSNAEDTTEHLREDTSIVPDPADRATIEEEHALELRTRDRERKLLKKISQSLVRIESGDYGFCDETGEPIGIARLLARPTATLSLEAQQRRELKQKMFGD